MILTIVGELANVVRHEIDKYNRTDIKELVSQKYVPIIHNNNLLSSELKSYYCFNKFTYVFLTNDEKQLIFLTECDYYNSDFYSDLLKFHHVGENLFKNINYLNKSEKVYLILTKNPKNSWVIDWNGARVNINLKTELNYILSKIKHLKFIH